MIANKIMAFNVTILEKPRIMKTTYMSVFLRLQVAVKSIIQAYDIDIIIIKNFISQPCPYFPNFYYCGR